VVEEKPTKLLNVDISLKAVDKTSKEVNKVSKEAGMGGRRRKGETPCSPCCRRFKMGRIIFLRGEKRAFRLDEEFLVMLYGQ
jgi:hypothetical protein